MRELIGIEKIHEMNGKGLCSFCFKEETDKAILCISFRICEQCIKDYVLRTRGKQFINFPIKKLN